MVTRWRARPWQSPAEAGRPSTAGRGQRQCSSGVEILESKVRLEGILKYAISGFSYPYGKSTDYSGDTIKVLREAGFDRACTSLDGPIEPSSDLMQLPRMHVADWDREQFARHLGISLT